MKLRSIVPFLALVAAASATPAQAAVDWHPVSTLELVRGIPAPQVAIDGSGKAAIVYSQSLPDGHSSPVRLRVRAAGARTGFFQPGLLPGGADPALAVNPAGAMVIATVEYGRLNVTLYPAPGPKPTPPWDGPEPAKLILDAAGYSVAKPRVAIDGAGVATIVWTSPPSAESYTPLPPPSRVYAVTVAPPGVAGPIQELGGPTCSNPRLDANLRGDAVVTASCSGTAHETFFRPAGGAFGPGEAIPGIEFPTDVTIDGSGEVLAYQAGDRSLNPREPYDYEAYYSTRPATGSFGAARRLSFLSSMANGLTVVSQEDGRAIAAWGDYGDKDARYAFRDTGGDFGPVRTIRAAGGTPGLVAAPVGPALFWWGGAKAGLFMTAVLSPDGSVGARTPIGVPATAWLPVFSPQFAINSDGRAVAAWEQRCEGGGFAVMTAVRDERTGMGPPEPPCQDTHAPKVIVTGKRASVRGRDLRVRVACDERCRMTASARVMRQGRRSPLATGKTTRELRLRARRGTWLELRLSAGERRRLAVALRARRRVSVRLAVSVRDGYGNGARRRLAARLVR